MFASVRSSWVRLHCTNVEWETMLSRKDGKGLSATPRIFTEYWAISIGISIVISFDVAHFPTKLHPVTVNVASVLFSWNFRPLRFRMSLPSRYWTQLLDYLLIVDKHLIVGNLKGLIYWKRCAYPRTNSIYRSNFCSRFQSRHLLASKPYRVSQNYTDFFYYLDQGMIKRVIDDWPRRLEAVIASNGGHFEWIYLLWGYNCVFVLHFVVISRF